MDLEIRTQNTGDVCTVELVGEVDVYSAPRLKQELVSAIEAVV